jgi:hypothetical protein
VTLPHAWHTAWSLPCSYRRWASVNTKSVPSVLTTSARHDRQGITRSDGAAWRIGVVLGCGVILPSLESFILGLEFVYAGREPSADPVAGIASRAWFYRF